MPGESITAHVIRLARSKQKHRCHRETRGGGSDGIFPMSDHPATLARHAGCATFRFIARHILRQALRGSSEWPRCDTLHPMNAAFTVRILMATELSMLDHVAPDVFDHLIDSRWATEFFADARHHLAVALDDDQVVGMASALHYVHPDKPPELWINEVGVAPPYQGQGIGKRLLHTLFAHGRTLGCAAAWVLTEDENTAARRLYSTVGGAESSAKLFSFALADEASSPPNA
jgi:GNAT superfamily N-acetyltransferase